MVVQGRTKTGIPLAINGIFGNMGVATAALLTGILADTSGWRSAFILPGVFSILVGCLYLRFIQSRHNDDANTADSDGRIEQVPVSRHTLLRVFSIVLLTTAIGGFVFQSTTFGLPKIFDERLANLAGTTTLVGWYVFIVFSLAALAQLVVGYLVDKHETRTVFAWVALLQSALFFAMIELQGTVALVVAIAFMLVVFGQIPINDVLIGRISKSEWRSRAYALRYIVTFSVMASALPIISWIHGTWGFDVLFSALSGAALVIVAGALCLPSSKTANKLAN